MKKFETYLKLLKLTITLEQAPDIIEYAAVAVYNEDEEAFKRYMKKLTDLTDKAHHLLD